MRLNLLLAIIVSLVVLGSIALVLPYAAQQQPSQAARLRTFSQSVSFPSSTFNRPISNNTDHDLDPALMGSWEVNIQSSLVPASLSIVTEAEIAFAPASSSEAHSIPTLIVQERADGLLRVEYFAQNWPNTYGLLLYNSSVPGWTGGEMVTLVFRSSGPPSQVDPVIAPRPNGSLDILVGGVTVQSAYPIAWANLSELYLYGYPGSSFIGGSIQLSFYQI